jgi:hypothetical protein
MDNKAILNKAILTGFKSVTGDSTKSGAPIDAYQVDAFRQNDILFERVIQSLMCSPFMPASAIDAPDLVIEANDIKFARTFLNVKTIKVTGKCTLEARVPLIWIARDRITIEGEIDAVGKGAQAEEGDFGGSGGGGLSEGKRCVMPFAPTIQILAGGAKGTQGLNLKSLLEDDWRLSRALLHLPFLVGGAAGADGGGAGGGVVCLCAPLIEFIKGGRINASGKPASVNKGGGGGGLVYLIAQRVTDDNEATINIKGGVSAKGTGGAGGDGKYIKHGFNDFSTPQ